MFSPAGAARRPRRGGADAQREVILALASLRVLLPARFVLGPPPRRPGPPDRSPAALRVAVPGVLARRRDHRRGRLLSPSSTSSSDGHPDHPPPSALPPLAAGRGGPWWGSLLFPRCRLPWSAGGGDREPLLAELPRTGRRARGSSPDDRQPHRPPAPRASTPSTSTTASSRACSGSRRSRPPAAGRRRGRWPPARPTTPFRSVIEGKDGWLYSSATCGSPAWPPGRRQTIYELPSAPRRGGEEAAVASCLVCRHRQVAIAPEHLPDTYPGKQCARQRKAPMWDALGGSRAARPGSSISPTRCSSGSGRRQWTSIARTTPLDAPWPGRLRRGAPRTPLPGLTDYDDVVQTGRTIEPVTWRRCSVCRHRHVRGLGAQRAGVNPRRRPCRPGPVRLLTTSTNAARFRPATLLLGDSSRRRHALSCTPCSPISSVLHAQSGARDPSEIADASPQPTSS